MTSELETFLEKFYNLPGSTLAQKWQNLAKLIPEVPQNHDVVVPLIVPRNHFECLLKIDILLKLQRTSDLMDVIKTGDETFALRILKNREFLKKLTLHLEQNVVDILSIFPTISFVVRHKLIAKLSRYGTKFDAIYNAILDRYGFKTAKKFLLNCTLEKIQNVLESKPELVLTKRQLKHLQKRSQELYKSYCETHHVSDWYFREVNDTELLLKAMKSETDAKLGKRQTVKFLKNHKEYAIDNSLKAHPKLHLKYLVRTLSNDEFNQFYMNCFPKKLSDLQKSHSDFRSFSSKLKPKRRFEMFAWAFAESFKDKSIRDYPEFISEEDMENFDADKREKWVKIKRKKDPSDDEGWNWIVYARAAKSIPEIKAKINLTNEIWLRRRYLFLLVETCKISRDLRALAEVMDYVCERHRNDNGSILNGFLDKTRENFDFKQLDERHWNRINEILAILDFSGNEYYDKNTFVLGHLEFLHRTTGSLSKESICDFINRNKGRRNWNFATTNPPFEKYLLQNTIALMPDTKHDLNLITSIINWNGRHPDDPLPFDARLSQTLRSELQKLTEDSEGYIDNNIKEIFEYFVCSKNPDLEILSAFHKLCNRYYSAHVFNWLLKFRPDIFDIDQFLVSCKGRHFEVDLKIFKVIKKFPQFCRTTIEVYSKETKSTDRFFVGHVFKVLAILMDPEEYLKSISVHPPPSNDRITSDFEDGPVVAICESFKYTTGNSTNLLEALIAYCNGDYKRYCLESVYYLCYHTPEDKVKGIIQLLIPKAVSLRKHAMFLANKHCTIADVLNVLKHFQKNERNVSVKTHMFRATFQYFLENPSRELCELLKLEFQMLHSNDEESFRLCVKCTRGPSEFRAELIESFYENLKSENIRRDLLRRISSETYKDLSQEFILDIINTEGKEHTDFVIHALIHANRDHELSPLVFDMLKTQLPKKRDFVLSFIDDLISEMFTGTVNEVILENIVRFVNEFLDPVDVFEQFLKINVISVKRECDWVSFPERIFDFLQNLVAKYEVTVVEALAGVLTEWLQFGQGGQNKLCEFCSMILGKHADSFAVCVLVLKMLPKKRIEDENKEEQIWFDQAVGMLKEVKHDGVRLLLNLFLNQAG